MAPIRSIHNALASLMTAKIAIFDAKLKESGEKTMKSLTRRLLNKLRSGVYETELSRTQYLSPEEMSILQTKRLSRILHNAVNSVPFYAQMKGNIDFDNLTLQD